jgi:Uma2 family endonuclease
MMNAAFAAITSAAEGLLRRRFTVAEVEAMAAAGVMEEDERVELIGGELVPMSPKGNHHETVKIALVDHWNRAATVVLVVEIADSSLGYDIGRKARLYASFGIREFWVIDAVQLTTRVFKTPSPDGYRETLDFGPDDLLAPCFGPEAFALRPDEVELE